MRTEELHAMKQILNDKGPLTHVKWVLKTAFKFDPPFEPESHNPKMEEKKVCLKVEFSTIS